MKGTRRERSPARPEHRSEGQRLLCELAISGAEIARRLGVSRQAVCVWRGGQKVPHLEQRLAIERAFPSVPATSWERDAGAADDDDAAPLPASREHAAAMLEDLERSRRRRGITSAELARLTTAIGRLLVVREQLEQLAEQRLESLVRSPAWQTLERTVLEALERHPAAARDVREALAAIATSTEAA